MFCLHFLSSSELNISSSSELRRSHGVETNEERPPNNAADVACTS